jgi:hypothetical protein
MAGHISPPTRQSSVSRVGHAREELRSWWPRRRWVYAAYVFVSVARIPARTGFHLEAPACDARFTLANVWLSLIKVPHIILFGVFFLLTLIQFDRVDQRSLSWSFIATLLLGALIEIEEGATGTGNCRIPDLLPDALGAFSAMAVAIGVVMVRGASRRLRSE